MVNGKYKGGIMKKKISIKGLMFKSFPQVMNMNVGEAIIPNGNLVEKIIYEDHCYNKGRQGKFPAYVVFFANSNVRHVVRETEISVAIVEIEEVEDEQAVPELLEQPAMAESPEVSA
jgi:hypothetical protein